MLSGTYYSQNYASIIRPTLDRTQDRTGRGRVRRILEAIGAGEKVGSGLRDYY